jgi:hypothetical protein
VACRTIATAGAAALLLLPGCGGDAGDARLTLTDDTCTYDGDETPPATAVFHADLENRSSRLGAFQLARIDEGRAFAEVEAYVETERRRLEKGLQMAGPPSFLTPMARTDIAPGATGVLVADLRPGTYFLWCAQDHPPTAGLMTARPLRVEPG